MKKEKPKQLTDLEIAIKLEEIGREPKKETLEQFMATLPYYGHCNYEYLEGIEEGAKWQQERMYSEEDMRKAFIAGGNSQIEEDDDYGTEYDAYMQEWFEQFKKKQ